MLSHFHISGSAYKIVNKRAYHHGTMLISTRLDTLDNLLRTDKVWFCPFPVAVAEWGMLGDLGHKRSGFCSVTCLQFTAVQRECLTRRFFWRCGQSISRRIWRWPRGIYDSSYRHDVHAERFVALLCRRERWVQGYWIYSQRNGRTISKQFLTNTVKRYWRVFCRVGIGPMAKRQNSLTPSRIHSTGVMLWVHPLVPSRY